MDAVPLPVPELNCTNSFCNCSIVIAQRVWSEDQPLINRYVIACHDKMSRLAKIIKAGRLQQHLAANMPGTGRARAIRDNSICLGSAHDQAQIKAVQQELKPSSQPGEQDAFIHVHQR